MRKYLLILLGSVIVFICWAKPDLIYRYWFDNDHAHMVEDIATETDVHVDADVISLSEGLHMLHLQIFDGDTPGALTSHIFVKSPTNGGNGNLSYWFDDNRETVQIIDENLSAIDIDVSGLTEGLHIINVQTNGCEPSPVRSSMFIKVPQIIGIDGLKCITYIDGALYRQDNVAANSGVVHYDMPIAGLSNGLHNMSVVLMTPTGGTSEIKKCYFLRHHTGNELSAMRCFYSIDGFSNMEEAARFDNGDYHFDVDVAAVKDGLHSITYMLTLDDGSISDIKTGIFYKIPLGGYGLAQYCYWLNDNDDTLRYVDIDGLPQELNLTTLIPVESQPFRSSLFHFEFNKNNEPYVYAANEFHFIAYSNDLHSAKM